MNVLSPEAKIIDKERINGLDVLKRIEKVGRVCYKSEDKITEDGESAKKFVRMLIKNEHEAMIENTDNISVLFTVDRGVTHELVRHRPASFAQESTRYCNYSQEKFGGDINVINIKTGIETEGKIVDPMVIGELVAEWTNAMQDAEKHYMRMLELGATPQIARSVLPTSVKADITVTANLREWRHILKLRAVGTTGRPHPQMVEIMVPLAKEFHELIPVVFDDIYEELVWLEENPDKTIKDYEVMKFKQANNL